MSNFERRGDDMGSIGNVIIPTPRGKALTGLRYLSLHRMLLNRTRLSGGRGRSPRCRLGHNNCAAWEGGPCVVELRKLDGVPA